MTGSAWLDREWSTSALAPALAGWDWFALQLDDGSNLMFYQLRQSDGTPAPESAGSLVTPDGTVEALTVDAVTLDVSACGAPPAAATPPLALAPARGLDPCSHRVSPTRNGAVDSATGKGRRRRRVAWRAWLCRADGLLMAAPDAAAVLFHTTSS